MKTEEDLQKSREIRSDLIKKWGEIPNSVWYVDVQPRMNFFQHYKTKEFVATEKLEKWMDKNNLNWNQEVQDSFKISFKSNRSKDSGLSIMPPNIVEKAVRFYSEKDDIVLDPFAGHNSRMQTVFENGRNYIGYDVCKEYIDFNLKIADILIKQQQRLMKTNIPTIIIRDKSSVQLEEVDKSVDFVFSSPPYWDIEFYDNDHRQLGNNQSYSGFLFDMKRVLSECHRVVKVGKFIVMNINDFRKDGVFYDYHCDIIRLGKEVGLKLHDVIIMAYQNSFRQAFAQEIDKFRETGKAHEYLVVFKRTREFI